MEMWQRIKQAREHAGLTQSELARRLGVRPQSAQQWEQPKDKGGTEPRRPRLEKIALATGVDFVWLQTGTGGIEGQRPHEGGNIVPGPDITGAVPLISWTDVVDWCHAPEGYRQPIGEHKVYTTKPHGPRAFSLLVQDDSMVNPSGRPPTYPKGSIIIVDPEKPASNGARVVAALDNGAEVTFKQLVQDAGRTYLEPLNPRYPVLDVTGRAEICGVVIQTVIDEE